VPGTVPRYPARFAEGLRALSEFYVDEGTLGDTLLRVARLACQATAADLAGIALLAEGKPATGVFPPPPEIDTAQYETGRGPGLDAFRRQKAYRIDSVAREDRWPEFTADAARHGVTATLSVPLSARGKSMGALSLYSRSTPFDDEAAAAAAVFASQAAIVLANAQVYWDARQLSENLREALRSRAAIDQAVGILMAGGGRTPEQAFQLLVAVSQRENRKLRNIAADVIERAAARIQAL
jgi:GAF domain-containing protein